jgi:hypothetical protein
MTIHFIILHKKGGPINAYTFLVEYYVETCFALALPRKEKRPHRTHHQREEQKL